MKVFFFQQSCKLQACNFTENELHSKYFSTIAFFFSAIYFFQLGALFTNRVYFHFWIEIYNSICVTILM